MIGSARGHAIRRSDMTRYDLLVIGGGINGAAIARDAALRGNSVLLVERDDLAAHTSSASSKLIHGGLRYLEYYEFRLVREGLRERAILLRTAPHIVRPLRFVMPHGEGMRPWWMIRAGLMLYDLLASGGSLPRARGVRADEDALRGPLKGDVRRPLAVYWDAMVDDARLVVLNALDAGEHGAVIATRTSLASAQREGPQWRAVLSDGRTVFAGAIVNAAGPWVAETLGLLREKSTSAVRLIKGSHIVVPRLADGQHGYILQQPDGRVVFALPYGAFTLIGTTDVPVGAPEDAVIDAGEIAYLCAASNRYFERQTTPADIVWAYSGVRSLYDDGAAAAQAVTRDYRLELDDDPGARLLSVFGGKITTARALAEEALDRLGMGGSCRTAEEPLPGGDIDDFEAFLDALPGWLPRPMAERMAGAYGTRLPILLADAAGLADLGRDFGSGLTEAELRYLIRHEFARTGEDILWRRTRLGLMLNAEQRRAICEWMDREIGGAGNRD